MPSHQEKAQDSFQVLRQWFKNPLIWVIYHILIMPECVKKNLKNTRLSEGENEKWHIPQGKNKKNGEYMDWVCKVSKSELLMTLRSATGNLKPFPFLNFACEAIFYPREWLIGHCSSILQLNKRECTHTHTQPTQTCTSIYTFQHTHTVTWLINKYKSKGLYALYERHREGFKG